MRSFFNSEVTLNLWCNFLRVERTTSSLEMKSLEDLTHLATNCNLPISDCSCCLVADVFENQVWRMVLISANLLGVTEMVIETVSKRTPKDSMIVEGDTALF